jgi:6-phosphogluconolactonase
MKVETFPSPEAIAHYAFNQIMITAETALEQRGAFSLVLSGGGTPEPLFRLFANPPLDDALSQQAIPWRHTHLFWGDERCVPPDQPGSSYGQAKNLFIDQVPIPPQNIHRAKGELSPQEAAQEYRNQLAKFSGFLSQSDLIPRFDLVLLGLGSDGHTASLFPNKVPPEAASETVIAVTADYDGRPAHRITMTPPVFNNARNILFLVTGANKAQAVNTLLNGPSQPDQYPAQRIQPTNGRTTILLDQPAAAQLND